MSVFVQTWTIFLLVIIKCISVVDGNAMLRPVSRGLMWTRRNQIPTNYNYMGVNCGGIARLRRNEGQCGLCGDPYDGPRRHETGGKFATGAIAQTYAVGKKKINVKILVNANQGGYFEFRLCQANGQPETQACFNQNLLLINEAVHQGETDRYYVESTGLLHLNLDIPQGLSCKQCVLQWKYVTDNMWGRDYQGRGCLGCGHQETFINCADIRIKGWNVPPTKPPTLPPTTPPPTTTTTTTRVPPITTTVARTTPPPIPQRRTTQRIPPTTIYAVKAGHRRDRDEKRSSLAPSWTQSGNKVSNSAPKTPLDLHNMAIKKQGPMRTRGPPPRPPPSDIPRPPKLSSQHIDALNRNGKLHVHNTNDNIPYIHIHASRDNKPYLYSAPPTSTVATSGNNFDRHRNEHKVTSHDFNHHGNNNNRHTQSVTTQRSWNRKPDSGRKGNGGRAYNEYTFTKLPINTFRTTIKPETRSFSRDSSFDQRGGSSFAERRGSFIRQENSRNYQYTPEPRTNPRNNWYSRTTTSTPKGQDVRPRIKTTERNQYSRYALSNADGFNKQIDKKPLSRQSERNGGTRGLSMTKKPRYYRGMVLDPMGEPITTTSTTPKTTTHYSRFEMLNRALPMSRELKTMYNLRNQLKADAEENRFRKPVVFERFTQFRIGKKGRRPNQEAYVGGERVLRVMPPSNEISKPFNNPPYMGNPSSFTETNFSSNILGIIPEQGRAVNKPGSIHGVDFLGQKPQRNEFAHRKHINTLHKESVPKEPNFQRDGGLLPIIAIHDGHSHSNSDRRQSGVSMNGVLGLYSQKDTGSLHHRHEITPSTTTTTRPTTTTMSPFRRQQQNPNYVFNNGKPPQSHLNQFLPNNPNQHFIQQPQHASSVQSADKRSLNSIPDIQMQSGQVFEKTMPPIGSNQFGIARNQFQPTNQLGNGMQGIDPLVEQLKSQILASVNTANNQMHGYNPNQFHPQPTQNLHPQPIHNLQTMQRVNSNPHVLPNSWQQNNQPFPHPNMNAIPAINNVHQTPNVNDLSLRLLQNQAIPQAPSAYVFPNIKSQNLFSSHQLHHLFPNNGAHHQLQDQNLQLLLQSLGQQSTTPQETTTTSTTTTQSTTTPTTTTTTPKPTTTTTATTTTTTQATTQLTIKPSTLNLETASSKELFQELKKFQEVMKRRPLNYEELQRQQALQTQLLKKLYEDQMKRMVPQYSSEKKTVAVQTPTPTVPTSTTTYPTTQKVLIEQNKIYIGMESQQLKQQTNTQSEIHSNMQNRGPTIQGELQLLGVEQTNHVATTEATRNKVVTTTMTLPSTKIQTFESLGQVVKSETASSPKHNAPNQKGALQNRLDKFVNTLATRMNTKMGEAEAAGKLQNVQVAPVSRDAIMKVLREMALDAMRKRKQNSGNKPLLQVDQTRSIVSRPGIDSQGNIILTRPSVTNSEKQDQTQLSNLMRNEKRTVVISDRLVSETLPSPVRTSKQMLVGPPSPPFIKQENINENAHRNNRAEEPVQHLFGNNGTSRMHDEILHTRNEMLHQRREKSTQAAEHYLDANGQGIVGNQDLQLYENIPVQRNKVPQTLEELKNQHIPLFKPLKINTQKDYVAHDTLTTRNSKPRQYKMLWNPSTTPIEAPERSINIVTKYPHTKVNNVPIETATETTAFTVKQNTHFNQNLKNTAGAFDKPNQRHENTDNTIVQEYEVTETVTQSTKTPAPGKKKLTQKTITELGNEILLQMKRLLARRNG